MAVVKQNLNRRRQVQPMGTIRVVSAAQLNLAFQHAHRTDLQILKLSFAHLALQLLQDGAAVEALIHQRLAMIGERK